jgi:hypothetical protein
MRKSLLLLTVALALGPVGCGKDTSGPVKATPEMEAQQKQAEQDVRNAEAANRKSQQPEKTHEQRVFEAESNRRR